MVSLPTGQQELLDIYLNVRQSKNTNIELTEMRELESVTELIEDSRVWYYPTRDRGLLRGHSIDHMENSPAGNHFNRYIFVKLKTRVNLYHFEGVPLFMSGFVVEEVPEKPEPPKRKSGVFYTNYGKPPEVPNDADTSPASPAQA